jgi:GT2 family glycosyltransferase
MEILVVDNDSGAPDRRLLATLDDVSLLLEPRNDGFGAGCNRGAVRAAGTYLLFVNPDIVVGSPTTLAELVTTAQSTADLGALGCRLVFEDGTPQPSAHRRYPDLAGHAWDYAPVVSSLMSRIRPGYAPSFFAPASYADGLLDVTHLLGAFLLVPRAVFRRAGGFDEGFFLYREETDLCQRIAALGLRILYTPQPVVVHRSGTSTHNREFANLDARYMRSTYRYLRLHHGALYVRAAWALAVAGMILSLPYVHLLRAVKRAKGGAPPDLDRLVARLPQAIAWHLRHARAVTRPVARQLPAF